MSEVVEVAPGGPDGSVDGRSWGEGELWQNVDVARAILRSGTADLLVCTSAALGKQAESCGWATVWPAQCQRDLSDEHIEALLCLKSEHSTGFSIRIPAVAGGDAAAVWAGQLQAVGLDAEAVDGQLLWLAGGAQVGVAQPNGGLAAVDNARNGLAQERAEDVAGDAINYQPLGVTPVLERKPRPKAWLLDEFVPTASLVMVYGESRSGKTTIVTRWVGDWITSGKRVILVAGEDWEGVQYRFQALRTLEDYRASDFEGALFLDDSDVQLHEERDSGAYGKLIQAVSAIGAEVVVVDTWIRSIDGAEQDERSVTRAIKRLERIKSLGATVIAIAHPGHNNDARPRGSSIQGQAFDTMIQVDLDPKAARSTLRVRKQKNGREGATATYGIGEVALEGGHSSVVATLESKDEARVLAGAPAPRNALDRRMPQVIGLLPPQGMAYMEWADLYREHIGLSDSTFARDLSKSLDRGLVESRASLYRRTRAGDELLGLFVQSEVRGASN